jgi:hypothetical protein
MQPKPYAPDRISDDPTCFSPAQPNSIATFCPSLKRPNAHGPC